jgi:signal transduction histidine kinase
VVPLVLGTSVLHRSDGELAGAILVFHDLSRVKEMAEEQRRIERLASVGAFAGKIAHEIKNPLVAIKTLAELLPDQYDDEEFRTTFTRIALQEVDRIDNLVRRLRGLKTSTTIHMQLIDILTPLEETLELLSAELQKRHIEVTRQYEPSLPQIIGSSDQLKQVFLNICLNSAEAMGQRGDLHIAVGVETERENTAVVITFSDTGPGIRAEVLDTLFEAFVTSKNDGSGLGMAICKDIVGLHHGTISAANRGDGAGAMFTIRLPLSQGDSIDESYAADHRLTRTRYAVSEFAE